MLVIAYYTSCVTYSTAIPAVPFSSVTEAHINGNGAVLTLQLAHAVSDLDIVIAVVCRQVKFHLFSYGITHFPRFSKPKH